MSFFEWGQENVWLWTAMTIVVIVVGSISIVTLVVVIINTYRTYKAIERLDYRERDKSSDWPTIWKSERKNLP